MEDKPDIIQVHAFVPRMLKRRLYAVLAMEEKRFSQWVREQMEVKVKAYEDEVRRDQ